MVVSCTSADGCNRKKIKKTNLQVLIRRSLRLFSIFNHGISTLLHLVKSGKQRLEHALFSECAVSDGPNKESTRTRQTRRDPALSAASGHSGGGWHTVTDATTNASSYHDLIIQTEPGPGATDRTVTVTVTVTETRCSS